MTADDVGAVVDVLDLVLFWNSPSFAESYFREAVV